MTACSGGSAAPDGGTQRPSLATLAASPSAVPPVATPTSTTSAPSPSAESGEDVARRAAAATGRVPWAARYRLVSNDTAQPAGTVSVAVRGADVRLDLTRDGGTAVLLRTAAGTVSCQLSGARRTCLSVAAAGEPLPAVFDPGLQRVFTSDLAALAAGRGHGATAGAVLAATGTLPAARCWQVPAATGLDAGTYCLSTAGVLRQATFASGVLSLTTVLPAPTPTRFTPPVRPQPLPSPS